MRQLRRAFQTGGFSVGRPPLLDPWRTWSKDATYRQAEWGRQVIVEYLRRVRLGLPATAYPAPPSNEERP